MGKRGKGEGGIFKYTRNVKNKHGTITVVKGWQGAVTTGYNENGKQKRKTVYGKTQAEVIAKVDEIKQQLANGTFSDTKLTVKRYLEQWLKEKARQVKPHTVELYREQAKRYVYLNPSGFPTICRR
jgi:integrase